MAPAGGGPRIWRLPVVLLGLLLLIAGVLGFVPVMFMFGATVLFFRLDGELTLVDDPEAWLWIAGLSVAGYLAIRIGLRLLRGRRQSALFLRRFGFTDATRVLSRAISRGMGRRWRLITLDDQQVVPVGVGGRSKVFVRLGPWLLAAVLVLLVVWVLPPWFDAQFDSAVDKALDEASENAEAEGANPVEAFFGAVFAAIIVSMVVGMVLTLVTLAPVALAGALALSGLGAGRALRRAEERSAVRIDTAGQIERAVKRAERATNRIYSSRLIVVRCAHDVWQQVVRRFADLTDVTLIDVSEASPGLLWELGELGPTLSTTWVLVGSVRSLEALLADGSENAVRLRTLLDGQSVLGYRPEDTRGFESALQARLSHVGTGR